MTAKKITTETKPTKEYKLDVDDMTIAELLSFIDGLCASKFKYYKHGKNLRAAFDALMKHPDELENLKSRLGLLRGAAIIPPAVVEAIQANIKSKISKDDMAVYLHRFKHLWVVPEQNATEEFNALVKALKKMATAALKRAR